MIAFQFDETRQVARPLWVGASRVVSKAALGALLLVELLVGRGEVLLELGVLRLDCEGVR